MSRFDTLKAEYTTRFHYQVTTGNLSVERGSEMLKMYNQQGMDMIEDKRYERLGTPESSWIRDEQELQAYPKIPYRIKKAKLSIAQKNMLGKMYRWSFGIQYQDDGYLEYLTARSVGFTKAEVTANKGKTFETLQSLIKRDLVYKSKSRYFISNSGCKSIGRPHWQKALKEAHEYGDETVIRSVEKDCYLGQNRPK